MVKKLRKLAESKSDNQLAKSVRDSAQQIWLAGLGAFVKAREDGTKVFETLVKEGRNIQARTREIAEERLDDVAGRVGEVTGRVGRQATESWDRLEQVFEQRVSRALSRLGLPTTEEIAALSERVERLAASVEALGGKPVTAKGSARRKAAPASEAAKAPAGKAAAKKGATKGATKAAAKGATGAAARKAAAASKPPRSASKATASRKPRPAVRKAKAAA